MTFADQNLFEQDPRWTAVDEYLDSHLNPPSRPYHKAIQHALDNSAAKDLRPISVPPSGGKFLSIQCQILGAKNVLEVGTLGAYSSIWMASSGPDVKVVSIEIDPQVAEVARENVRNAGLEDRIEIVVGGAADILPQLVDSVKQGKRAAFDFSFIDADKPSALHYFNWCKTATRKRGVIYIDNMVRRGELANAELAKTDEAVQGIRSAVESIGKDDSVDAVVLQTVSEKSYDGFLMAIVK
ncbi:MAG: hypothetical protein Q9221_003687 [Calogaya cf. arnoldii]